MQPPELYAERYPHELSGGQRRRVAIAASLVLASLGDRIDVMYLGRIEEEAPAREIVRDPPNPYTRALLSVVPKRDPHDRTMPQILTGETPDPIACLLDVDPTLDVPSPRSVAGRSIPSWSKWSRASPATAPHACSSAATIGAEGGPYDGWRLFGRHVHGFRNPLPPNPREVR